MKIALAALVLAVAVLFSQTAKADPGFTAHSEPVQTDEGTVFQSTLSHEGQVVWSGRGLIEVVTPMTLVVDEMVVRGAWQHHDLVTYRWNGQKFVTATVAGFSMHVEAHKVVDQQNNYQGTVFTTTLTFPGYAPKTVRGIVQNIDLGTLYVDQAMVKTDGQTTHEVNRFTMGRW